MSDDMQLINETKEVDWNVISEEDFKKRVSTVFDKVAQSLSKTLGPYGSTTIIEKYGEMHITKDGWQVLKNIRFNNMLENNIMSMLLRISAQVVVRVGDGSTSSIVAADAILKELNKSTDIIKKLRPKELMDILNACTGKIVEYIYNDSKKINKDNFDEIYRLAYVSTNGDDNIANIIKDIYIKTSNPSIEYINSKTNKTSYEIVNGYRANITYLDNIFVTSDDGNCTIENPEILIFDHKVDIETSLRVISTAVLKTTEVDQNKKLVVIAPHYDKLLLEKIRQTITMEYRQRGTSTIVYARASLISNMSHELYNDFAILCGAQVISEQFVEEINEKNIEEYLGSVEEMVIGDTTTFISGFTRRNDNMYKKIIDDATVKYNTMLADNEAKGLVDIRLNDAKQRLTKLNCNMGIISVGGNSELEKKANYDLVEDAVKACESAYNYGYNVGCSLAIPHAIFDLVQNNKVADINNKYGSELIKDIFNIIYLAYLNVYKRVLRNKFIDEPEKVEEILNTTFENNFTKAYNLITNEYSDDIINSCETDIEILKASISIISLLVSSNQYISINPKE